jgi:N-acetylglucosaminyl-diphospho-decaprenol L-rhamnosyltransferase
MKVYISVTSHNNDDLIKKNFINFPREIGKYKIIICIIDNVGSKLLEELCIKEDINYFFDGVKRGYGANNNKNFSLYDIEEGELFIVSNPDISIPLTSFEKLLDQVVESSTDIYGVKVFESEDFSKCSSHNRSFPALLDPIISLLFKKKLFAQNVDTYANPDWIGGGFMIFKAKSFKELNGFDESYFMYYEDVDICNRAKFKNMTIVYNPKYYIIHEAKREGRRWFSKNFFWNLRSMVRYFSKFPPKKLISLKKVKND